MIWRRPDTGWVTCNIDVTVFERSGKNSFECLLINDMGDFVARYGDNLVEIPDPKIVKALVFREVLSWMKEMCVTGLH